MAEVITRFAPSPTGFLHIGGARTALFNWLYAKKHGGKFLLRIEDTDKKRSTQEAINVIIEGLQWLELNYDGKIIFQSQQIQRHIEIVNLLIQKKSAYYCYCSEIEVEQQRTQAQNAYVKHLCPYRNDNNIIPDKKKVVRFKAPLEGATEFNDGVYGKIAIQNTILDDMIIMRSDGTPTYMFAVVVDDHDMNITDIIRGNDHSQNTLSQILIYKALNWTIPNFFHIPLIHDEHGHKLSKRQGAVSITEYQKMGIMPEAMNNYLLRMGWSCGDKEIIVKKEAIHLFNTQNIGISPACFDFKKLEYLNSYYINKCEDEVLLNLITPILEKKVKFTLNKRQKMYIFQDLSELKKRAKSLNDFAEIALFYIENSPITINVECKVFIDHNKTIIPLLLNYLLNIEDKSWSKNELTSMLKQFSIQFKIDIKIIYKLLRCTLSGTMNSISILDIITTLGKDEALERIKCCISKF